MPFASANKHIVFRQPMAGIISNVIVNASFRRVGGPFIQPKCPSCRCISCLLQVDASASHVDERSCTTAPPMVPPMVMLSWVHQRPIRLVVPLVVRITNGLHAMVTIQGISRKFGWGAPDIGTATTCYVR